MTKDVIQCRTCGIEYRLDDPPSVCPICNDERQYVPSSGQAWFRPQDFEGQIDLVEHEPGLWGINVTGGIGIGQQAKVLTTEAGCVMVDAPASISPAAVDMVRALGDFTAIIPTHPHMFGLQSLWSSALGDVPVWVARADAEWLGARPAELYLWDGTEQPVEGVTAVQLGGHFPGSSVVHWTGQDNAGVLLTGDTIAANVDRRTVTFLRSYPNRIPLSAAVVERISRDVRPYTFDRLYGSFLEGISAKADAAVARSAQRYIDWVNGRFDHLTGPGAPSSV